MATGMLAILFSLLVITMGARVRRAQGFKLHPKNNDEPTPCTFNNREGICVHESACDAEHRIWEGGVIDDILFRNARQCKQNYWCCSTPTKQDRELTDEQMPDGYTTDEQATDRLTTTIRTTDIRTVDKPATNRKTTDRWASNTQTIVTSEQTTEKSDPRTDIANDNNNCLALEADVCPWCVLLYHSDGGQTAQNPFCLGALIGSKAIITASTCLMRAVNKTLYARLPNSSYPGKNYIISQRLFHPDYYTGTHAYDIGLLVIESDVTLQKSQGACLDFLGPLEGDCVGYGFDINWQIYSTILEVKNNSCGKAGNTDDAACGTNADAVCLVDFGAPILCPTDDNRLVLRGIARGRCDSNDQMLLGGIARSYTWIEKELEYMTIRRDSYILS
ncbi:uncharacterized protein LOC123865350 isoform X2 [Maniola jurtina]|nr:uncharacterized protein LOC123865350 isoform X2 [Maniola jurtina]XP_045762294.1 uncharacterized protein LOC123865350 isoform X2 [Maniola jurtina]